MKKFLFFISMVLTAAACQKSNDTAPFVEATVTVKTAADLSCYLQLDDETALKPTNDIFKTNPYGKEVRAHIFYYDNGEINSSEGGYKWKSAKVSAIDTILTKKPVEAGAASGDASLEICRSWANSIEDGYLTLCFEGLWGNTGKVHYINLVKTGDPLVFELKHDSNGDTGLIRNAGLIAFDLHSMPVPDSEEYDVVIKYEGYSVAKKLTFHYMDGKYTITGGTQNDLYQ